MMISQALVSHVYCIMLEQVRKIKRREKFISYIFIKVQNINRTDTSDINVLVTDMKTATNK